MKRVALLFILAAVLVPVAAAQESFQVGAYGSDHMDRRRLPSLAARRAHALLGTAFDPAAQLRRRTATDDPDSAPRGNRRSPSNHGRPDRHQR